MTSGARQFLAFRFGTGSRFEGQLVGALERIESRDIVRVLDGLFVAREPESGEVSAIALGDSPPSRRTMRMLGFRLDDDDRRKATRKALAGDAGEVVRSLAAVLTPGNAIAAVLLENTQVDDTWAEALTDAVARVDGTWVANTLVDAGRMSELAEHLRDAVARAG
jgi:hypothetical protein